MGEAKKIILRPIPARQANELVRRVHYSGKVLNNSKIHIGAFYRGRLEGAIQFGPSMDKSKLLGLVRDTQWGEFIELNRVAFTDALPRNSESRALSIAMRVLKKHVPLLKWVVSFADATQCGDGAIYRASGFALTGIRPNNQIIEFPDGLRETRLVLTNCTRPRRREVAKRYGIQLGGGSSMKPFFAVGARALPGYQLRYLYFLDPTARQRLTVPIIPFSAIPEDARMYRGEKLTCAGSVAGDASATHAEEGGSIPTPAL